MKKTKKRLLGFLGLAVIVVAGLVAYRTVNYDAEAVSSITDEIIVKVYDKYPHVKITDPANEAILVGAPHTITYEWENSQYADFTLSYNGTVITTWHEDYGHFEPGEHPTGSGSHDISLNEYGKYILSVSAVGEAGPVFTDSIAIYRLSTSVSYIGANDDNDPRFNIQYEPEIKKLEVQIFSEDGTQQITDLITIDVPEGSTSLEKLIEMPAGTPTGRYKIVVNGLDAENKIISDSSFTFFEYNSPIAVPDTGQNRLNLNIARTDFLITGLLIFFAATIAAIFLLNRKNEQ